ncbi:cation channel sperm-associated protein subunit beta protein family-domain-containing protein [Obelidium mucronatum]|nr:cation channel sperm-associated protein subunit beta protein family-domain-containing protein [Obelidium mucronatum]
MTHSFAAHAVLNDQKTGWSLNVSSSTSLSATVVTVSSSGSEVLGCGTKQALFDVSPEAPVSFIGHSLDNTEAGLLIKTENYLPAYFRVFKNMCFKKSAIAVLGASSSSSILGGSVIVTNDGFSTRYLRDLSRVGNSPESTICYGVVNCATTMRIYYSAILNSVTVFATNRGIFLAASLFSSEPKFSPCTTGQSVLDQGKSTQITGSLNLVSTANCLKEEESFVFIMFSTPPSLLRNNLIYSNPSGILSNAWSSNIPISSITGATVSHGFVSAARYSLTATNIYLLGVPHSPCGNIDCADNSMIVVHNTTTSKFSVSFTFPSTLIVTNLSCHDNGIDCYVYGSQLWHSIDGGQNWMQIYSAEVDIFEQFDSSWRNGIFTLVTNQKGIYYGRAGSAELIKVNTFNPPTSSFVASLVSEVGDVFGLSLATISSTYSSTASDYPMGFLKTITGDVRDSSNPYMLKIAIPIDSITPTSDVSFAESLVPIFIGKYRVQLFGAASSPFKAHHVGMMLSIVSGGSALIDSISSGGRVADCTITQTFKSDTNTASSAVDMDIIISASVANIASPLISDSTSTSTTTSLVLTGGSGSGIWMFSDIGKTVVANQGSFLITDISSDTTATAIVLRPPTVAGTVLSSKWQLFDLRSFLEYAKTGNSGQSLSWTSVVSGFSTVTLSTGSPFSFQAAMRGYFLVTSSGWGSIQEVVSTTSVKVSWFGDPGSTTTAAARSWSVFDTTDSYSPGVFPSIAMRTRPWNITVKTCPWTSLSENTEKRAKFLGYDGSYDVLSSVQTAPYIDNPYYPVIQVGPLISNPGTHDYHVSTTQDVYKHVNSVGVKLKNIGIQGFGSISMRLSCGSLSCSTSTERELVFVDGCSPSHWLSLNSSGESLVQSLPVNYRPPSSLGTSIPTSDSIYNADPASPRYNNRYSISQRTGQFKQCLGATSRSNCACEETWKDSSLVRYSDCITQASSVYNDQTYIPKFLVHDAATETSSLTMSYTLTELNNRTDYCILDNGTTTICGADILYTTLIHPLQNSSIVWLSSSSELYHFRAQVVENEFCSNFATEFMVWVLLPTPRTSTMLTFMSVVVVAFVALLMLMYLIGWERQKRMSF